MEAAGKLPGSCREAAGKLPGSCREAAGKLPGVGVGDKNFSNILLIYKF